MMDFLSKEVKGNKFELLIDTKIFPKDIILKASYNFLDKGYFFFKLDNDKNIILHFTPKDGIKEKSEFIIGNFSDELLSVLLRDKLEKDNKDIREKIVGAAIANSLDSDNFVEFNTDNLSTKTIRIYVKDNNNNLTHKDVVLEIYSPTPQINTVTGAIINGQLNEKISGEPIDIYRFRDSILEKVNKKQNSVTDLSGNYQFEASSLEKGLTLKNSSGSVVATIDERTGKIELKSDKYLLRIKEANENSNLSLEIYDKNNKEVVYTQNFNLTANRTLEQVDDFTGITNNGLYFKSNDSVSKLEKNSTNSPVLPNGGFIVNSLREPIIGISTSGNIYIVKSGYKLNYSYNNNYIVIDILNLTGNKIGGLLYKIDSEFLIN